MASSINASTSSGIVQTADTSGILNLQSNGTTKVAVSSSGVDLTGLSKSSLPTGSVLQVVNATQSTQVSNTTTTYVSSGLTATITPTFATSKILVVFTQNLFLTLAAANSKLNLYRNGSSIKTFEYTGYSGNGTLMIYPTCQFLDSPSATTATTYAIYFNSVNGTTNIVANYTDAAGSPVSTITLMEIAA